MSRKLNALFNILGQAHERGRIEQKVEEIKTGKFSDRTKTAATFLNRAFEQGRADEAFRDLQSCLENMRQNVASDKAAADYDGFMAAHENEESRAVRALNLLEQKAGSPLRYRSVKPGDGDPPGAANFGIFIHNLRGLGQA